MPSSERDSLEDKFMHCIHFYYMQWKKLETLFVIAFDSQHLSKQINKRTIHLKNELLNFFFVVLAMKAIALNKWCTTPVSFC